MPADRREKCQEESLERNFLEEKLLKKIQFQTAVFMTVSSRWLQLILPQRSWVKLWKDNIKDSEPLLYWNILYCSKPFQIGQGSFLTDMYDTYTMTMNPKATIQCN